MHSSSPLFTVDTVNLLWYDILRKIYREPCGFYNSQGFFYTQGDAPMPRRPQRPCSYPGCPNRCDGQYCEEHAKQMNHRYNKFVRPADSNKKYGRAWREIRKRYATAHPLCEMCLKEGRLTPVEEVHHIVPVSRGGSNNDFSNLMSLCQSCHTKIHHDLGDR